MIIDSYRATRDMRDMRVASCEEVNCRHWAAGWITIVDPMTELGSRQAHYIRTHSGRTFTEHRAPLAELVAAGVVIPDSLYVSKTAALLAFDFPPGQECFEEHHVPRRPPLYRIVSMRESQYGTRHVLGRPDAVHPSEWMERLQDNLGRLQDIREKG